MSRRRFRVNGTSKGLTPHGQGTDAAGTADGLGTATGPAPYHPGWQAPWRGEWGPLGDYHSKLGRLVDREARQLAQLYPGADPLGLRREIAELRAIAKMQRAQLGLDPKVTVRKITAVEKIADWKLARLEALASANGPGGPSLATIRARYARPAEASS